MTAESRDGMRIIPADAKPTFIKATFYASVRAHLFAGKLTHDQVVGMDAILKAFADYDVTDKRHQAYMLATAYHETSRTMQPIKEYGGYNYFMRMYDVTGERPSLAKANGNTTKGDGAKYCGRGYVQLTWKNNYKRAGVYLGIDLVASPDLALLPEHAAQIMCIGMNEGWFTGKKLGDYFTAQKTDWINARRIINGKDKADLIATYAVKFLTALEAAG